MALRMAEAGGNLVKNESANARRDFKRSIVGLCLLSIVFAGVLGGAVFVLYFHQVHGLMGDFLLHTMI